MAATLGTGLELYIDADGSAARAYAHSGAVPDTVILDRQHRVIARHGGIEPRIEALIAMQIRRGLGLDAPLLLSKQGYNGQESCATCHQGAHETWSLTNHAYAFDTLVEGGYPPEIAYYECLHERKLLVDFIHEGGMAYMRYTISDTAEYGDYTRGPKVIDDHVRQNMKQVLQNIRSGAFAREWILENQAGRPSFNALRRQNAEHMIETVGSELRAMMPWLKKD